MRLIDADATKEALRNRVGENIYECINNVPTVNLTASVLADMLMEERIRGELDSDTTFEKDIIDDVRCKLTVDIIDHRPCYCGAGLREVWRESEDEKYG